MRGKIFFTLLSLILLFTIFIVRDNATKGETEDDGKKVLVFGRGADSVQLDASKVTDGESIYVTNQIYDTLVRYKQENTQVVSALAIDWHASENGKEWTFKLRKGVKFHDGTDFNAEDVVYNFDRWASSRDFVYYGYMFGASEDDPNGIIEKVEAINDYEVKFTLEESNASFLYTLAMPPFAIASPDAIEKYGDDYFKHPVGTGAFIFNAWIKNDKIILQKNPDYFDKAANVDTVIFRVIPDNNERLKELQAGRLDIMDGLNPKDIPTVQADANLQVIFRPSMNVAYMALNTGKNGPLSDKRVRQAINLAIDKEQLISMYEGIGKPAKNPIPPSLMEYNDDIEDYGYDIGEAKRLLAEAGYANGFSVTLYIMSNSRPSMPQPALMAQAVKRMLRDVNITVQIVENNWETHLIKTQNGEHDMAFMGWIGDNGDADNFLYVLLDKDNAKKGYAGNIAFYKNDEVHDLLKKARNEIDKDKRTELYRRVQEIIHEDAPWVPIAHITPPLAINKRVKNFIPHATGSEPFNHIVLE